MKESVPLQCPHCNEEVETEDTDMCGVTTCPECNKDFREINAVVA